MQGRFLVWQRWQRGCVSSHCCGGGGGGSQAAGMSVAGCLGGGTWAGEGRGIGGRTLTLLSLHSRQPWCEFRWGRRLDIFFFFVNRDRLPAVHFLVGVTLHRATKGSMCRSCRLVPPRRIRRLKRSNGAGNLWTYGQGGKRDGVLVRVLTAGGGSKAGDGRRRVSGVVRMMMVYD